MDFSDFRTHKDAGRISVIRLGSGFAITKRQWNPDTGEEIEPEVETLDRNVVEERRRLLASQLEELEALIAEMQGKE